MTRPCRLLGKFFCADPQVFQAKIVRIGTCVFAGLVSIPCAVSAKKHDYAAHESAQRKARAQVYNLEAARGQTYSISPRGVCVHNLSQVTHVLASPWFETLRSLSNGFKAAFPRFPGAVETSTLALPGMSELEALLRLHPGIGELQTLPDLLSFSELAKAHSQKSSRQGYHNLYHTIAVMDASVQRVLSMPWSDAYTRLARRLASHSNMNPREQQAVESMNAESARLVISLLVAGLAQVHDVDLSEQRDPKKTGLPLTEPGEYNTVQALLSEFDGGAPMVAEVPHLVRHTLRLNELRRDVFVALLLRTAYPQVNHWRYANSAQPHVLYVESLRRLRTEHDFSDVELAALMVLGLQISLADALSYYAWQPYELRQNASQSERAQYVAAIRKRADHSASYLAEEVNNTRLRKYLPGNFTGLSERIQRVDGRHYHPGSFIRRIRLPGFYAADRFTAKTLDEEGATAVEGAFHELLGPLLDGAENLSVPESWEQNLSLLSESYSRDPRLRKKPRPGQAQ